MTTELLSGQCAACNYDKLIIRTGSSGWATWEYCPSCGFGYLDAHQTGWSQSEGDVRGFANQDAFEQLTGVFAQYMGLAGTDPAPTRQQLFEWAESQSRDNNMNAPLFVYSPEEISQYQALQEPVFGQKRDQKTGESSG